MAKSKRSSKSEKPLSSMEEKEKPLPKNIVKVEVTKPEKVEAEKEIAPDVSADSEIVDTRSSKGLKKSLRVPKATNTIVKPKYKIY